MSTPEHVAREYRRVRREDPYTSARYALHVARRANYSSPHDWTDDGDGMVATLPPVDGFTITARAVPLYEPADLDFWGEFTDDDGPDTVPNPCYEHGSYKRFRPTYSMEERFADYRRTMPAAVARDRARADAERDARSAVNAVPFHVTVEASRCGKVYGVAGLGSEADEWVREVDADGVIDEYDLAGEAVADAWRTLAAELGLDSRLYDGEDQIDAGAVYEALIAADAKEGATDG